MSPSSTSHFLCVIWHSLDNFRRQGATHWANSATFSDLDRHMTSFQLRTATRMGTTLSLIFRRLATKFSNLVQKKNPPNLGLYRSGQTGSASEINPILLAGLIRPQINFANGFDPSPRKRSVFVKDHHPSKSKGIVTIALYSHNNCCQIVTMYLFQTKL